MIPKLVHLGCLMFLARTGRDRNLDIESKYLILWQSDTVDHSWPDILDSIRYSSGSICMTNQRLWKCWKKPYRGGRKRLEGEKISFAFSRKRKTFKSWNAFSITGGGWRSKRKFRRYRFNLASFFQIHFHNYAISLFAERCCGLYAQLERCTSS